MFLKSEASRPKATGGGTTDGAGERFSLGWTKKARSADGHTVEGTAPA